MQEKAVNEKRITCTMCDGQGKHRAAMVVQFTVTPGQAPQASAHEPDEDEWCPKCGGTGKVLLPPFGNGRHAKIEMEKVSELASAGTLLRCIDHPLFVEAVANQAAKITLPDEVIAAFVEYWADPGRDANLGEYIHQIAEYAEELALKVYGSLDNGFYAFARPHDPKDAILGSSAH